MIYMSKNKKGNRLEISADKVHLKSERNGITEENQNQQRNTQKQAMGPNNKR